MVLFMVERNVNKCKDVVLNYDCIKLIVVILYYYNNFVVIFFILIQDQEN